jgi:hypothetical protein
MKLSYSIPGKIWWITNFLDYSMYKGIHDAIINEREKINLHTTKGIWGDNLIDNIKLIISKYNKDEIKKQNLTKENLKNFTDPYFELFEKIEKQLESIDDKMEWFQNNKKLGEDYVDVKKNFMRRIKSQLKKSKKDKSEKPESEKKKSKKLGWFDALKKYQEENKGVYVIPKKGTAEYKRVKEIQMEGK